MEQRAYRKEQSTGQRRESPSCLPCLSSPLKALCHVQRTVTTLLLLTIVGCSGLSTTPSTVATIPPSRANGVRYGNTFYCFRGFKRCPSGIEQCVDLQKQCDGVTDCDDGSDEGSHCKTFDCTAVNRLKCPSGNICMNVSSEAGGWRYIFSDPYRYYLCDGIKDCSDGSDEDPEFCSSYNCADDVPHTGVPGLGFSTLPAARVRCPGGKGVCILEDELCDGIVQCLADGGSDEGDQLCKERGCSGGWLDPRDPPTCKGPLCDEMKERLLHRFQCSSGRCITKDRLCDGELDCPGGEDEGSLCANVTRCQLCPEANGRKCLYPNQICNGVADCPNGADEKGCDVDTCPWGRCPSNRMCAPISHGICDGKAECSDGSDEDPNFCRRYKCSRSEKKCPNRLQCVKKTRWCDGVQDCPDASDEDPAFCRAQRSCADDLFIKCPGRAKTCVTITRLCNGEKDCLDGSDEDPKFCRSKKTALIIGTDNRVRCDTNKTNYISGDYCDGIKNCEDGSDEKSNFCRRYECKPGYIKCAGTKCVARCNGEQDCPDGSDERGCPPAS